MKKLIILGIALSVLTACGKSAKIQTITGYAQGTTYSVKYWHNPNTDSPIDNNTLKQSMANWLVLIN